MKMNNRHLLISKMLGAGCSHAEIGETVGMHAKSIARLAMQPEMKAAVEAARKEFFRPLESERFAVPLGGQETSIPYG